MEEILGCCERLEQLLAEQRECINRINEILNQQAK